MYIILGMPTVKLCGKLSPKLLSRDKGTTQRYRRTDVLKGDNNSTTHAYTHRKDSLGNSGGMEQALLDRRHPPHPHPPDHNAW